MPVLRCRGASVPLRDDRTHGSTAALLGARLAAGPLQVGARVAGWTFAVLAKLGADGPSALRWQFAGLFQVLPERKQLVRTGVRLRMAIVGALELDEIAHLVE